MNQPAPGMSQGFLETFEGGNDGPDIGKVSIRFAGAREDEQGRCGVFAFGMNTQLAGEPSLFLRLHGEFLLRIADGAPVRLEMSGPARIAGRQTLEGVDGNATAPVEMQATWRTHYVSP